MRPDMVEEELIILREVLEIVLYIELINDIIIIIHWWKCWREREINVKVLMKKWLLILLLFDDDI